MVLFVVFFYPASDCYCALCLVSSQCLWINTGKRRKQINRITIRNKDGDSTENENKAELKQSVGYTDQIRNRCRSNQELLQNMLDLIEFVMRHLTALSEVLVSHIFNIRVIFFVHIFYKS